MCGIVHVRKADNIKKSVVKRYNRQHMRGSEGFGYVALKGGVIVDYQRTQKEKEIIKKLEAIEADEVIFHHRFPTSTPNVAECAHPIEVKHKSLMYRYYLVHNGHIGNAGTLKKEHEKLGFEYQTAITTKYETKHQTYLGDERFNDSESLGIELARFIEGKSLKIDTIGDVAFILLQADGKKARKLFYGSNGGNPLTKETRDGFFSLTSEGGGLIKSNVLYEYDYLTDSTTSKEVVLGDDRTRSYGYGLGFTTNYPYRSKEYYQSFDWDKDDEERDGDIADSLTAELAEIEGEITDLLLDKKRAEQSGDYDETILLEAEIEVKKAERKDKISLLKDYGYNETDLYEAGILIS